MSKITTIIGESGEEIAWGYPASDESVRIVLDAGANTDDGRSSWKWIRFSNGDLILGVFPRGETYFEVEIDAAFPTEIGENYERASN